MFLLLLSRSLTTAPSLCKRKSTSPSLTLSRKQPFWFTQAEEDVAESSEPERGGAQQIGRTAHEHQCRQGLAGRPQDQPRPQRHHQDVYVMLDLFFSFSLSFLRFAL